MIETQRKRLKDGKGLNKKKRVKAIFVYVAFFSESGCSQVEVRPVIDKKHDYNSMAENRKRRGIGSSRYIDEFINKDSELLD